MTLTNLQLKDMKENYHYIFTNQDFELLYGKMLTVKKSEDYFILTYYDSANRDEESEKLRKFEINWTNANIYHYPIALKKAEILAMLDDSAPIVKVLQTMQIGIKSKKADWNKCGIREI